MTMALDIRIQRQEGTGQKTRARVLLSGRLDTAASAQLEQEFAPLVELPVRALILDLSELQFISSAGLWVVLKAKRDIEAAGGIFVMTGLQPQIEKVFDIVKALPGLSIFSSEAELEDYLEAMQQRAKD
jgi:anti-sigma B factor antagonist